MPPGLCSDARSAGTGADPTATRRARVHHPRTVHGPTRYRSGATTHSRRHSDETSSLHRRAGTLDRVRARGHVLSVNVGVPGVYGRDRPRRFPGPALINTQPVYVQRGPARERPAGLPACAAGLRAQLAPALPEYNACGQPVYFVQRRLVSQHLPAALSRGARVRPRRTALRRPRRAARRPSRRTTRRRRGDDGAAYGRDDDRGVATGGTMGRGAATGATASREDVGRRRRDRPGSGRMFLGCWPGACGGDLR